MEYLVNRRSGYSFNQYKVQVVMLFNSFEDIIGELNFTGSDEHFNALDVLIGFPEDIQKGKESAFRTYMTHMDLGYSEESISELLKSKFSKQGTMFNSGKYAGKTFGERRELISAVLNGLTFRLDMVCHKWSFDLEENGMITLTLDYMAYEQGVKEGMFSNIIMQARFFKELKKLSDDVQKAKINKEKGNKVSKGLSKQGKALQSGNRGFLNADCDDLLKGKTGIAERIQCLRFMGYNWIGHWLLRLGCIHYAYVDSEDIWNRKDLLKKVNAKTKKTNKNKKQVKVYSGDHILIRRHSFLPGKSKKITKDQKKALAEDVKNGNNKATSKRSTVEEIKTEDFTTAMSMTGTSKLSLAQAYKKIFPDLASGDISMSALTAKLTEIQFVYLGDLFQIIADRYATNINESTKGKDKIEVLLDFGTIIMKDLRNLDSGKMHEVNIADIPINLDSFNAWWTKKVVATDRTVYKFGEFVRDFFSDLIKNVMADKNCGYVADDGISAPQDISISVHEVMVKVSESYRIIKYYFYQDEENIVKKDVVQFYFGNRKGIAKRITLKKRNNAFLRSSAISKVVERSSDPSMEVMREVYDSEVTCYGNAYLQPGMYYEVQPSILGLGDINAEKNKSMKLFGLGGQYAINKTEIKFENGVFETILTGFWQVTNEKRVNNESGKISENNISVGAVQSDDVAVIVTSGVLSSGVSVLNSSAIGTSGAARKK